MNLFIEFFKQLGRPHSINIKFQLNEKISFLSIEPLLEDLWIVDFSDIHWVIVSGESGNKARKMKKTWVENIQKQYDEQNIAFFFILLFSLSNGTLGVLMRENAINISMTNF